MNNFAAKSIQSIINHQKLYAMKRSILLIAGCAIASILLFAACGGGGTASFSSIKVKDFPENEVFGKVPVIFRQTWIKDSIIQEIYQAERDRIREKSNYDELDDKLTKDRKLAEQKVGEELETVIENEKAKLIGKKVPFELEEGAWYEITDLYVSDLVPDGIRLTGSFKVVDETQARKSFDKYYYPMIYFVYLDSKGNESSDLGVDLGYRKPDDINFITTLTRYTPDHCQTLLDFAKIKFLK
jgi:ABC-type antimicrobial peptide transport system permease subunit